MLVLNLRIITAAAVVLLVAGTATAQSTSEFEELSGKFVIDLPQSYELNEQKFPTLFQFSGEAGSILLFFDEEVQDTAESYKSAIGNLDGMLKNSVPVSPVVTMTLNGSQAKWGVYKGTAESDGVQVPLFAYVGSVLLDGGSMFFVSFLSEDNLNVWGDKITKAFHSIRNVDSPLSGVRDVKPAAS